MKIEINKEELKEIILNSTEIQSELAKEVVRQMKDYNWEYKQFLLEVMWEVYKEVSEEFIKDYVYNRYNIKDIIQRLSKDEIIKMMSK